MSVRDVHLGEPDVANTVQMIGIHGADPTSRRGPGTFAKAVLTPDGPGTTRLAWNTSGNVTAGRGLARQPTRGGRSDAG